MSASTEKKVLPFNGTKEQEKQLVDFINENKDMPGVLMPVLQKAQDIYGYIPKEVQLIIAKTLDVPMSEIYGIVTFYSQFSLTPKGKNKISVCLGTACYVKGAGDVYEKFCQLLNIKDGECTEDGEFSIDACRCIGACGLAPVLTVNDEVFGKVTVDDVETIIAKFRA